MVVSAQCAMDWSPSCLFVRVAFDLQVVSMDWKHLYLDHSHKDFWFSKLTGNTLYVHPLFEDFCKITAFQRHDDSPLLSFFLTQIYSTCTFKTLSRDMWFYFSFSQSLGSCWSCSPLCTILFSFWTVIFCSLTNSDCFSQLKKRNFSIFVPPLSPWYPIWTQTVQTIQNCIFSSAVSNLL